MTQSWKNWRWKLGLGIAVATSAIASGYYALAVQIQVPMENRLRLISITSDASANNPSPGKIYVNIQEKKQTSGPYPINPGQEVPLGIDVCFQNTLTVKLFDQVNEEKPQFIDQKPVSIISVPPLVFEGKGNGVRYTLNYQIVPFGCSE